MAVDRKSHVANSVAKADIIHAMSKIRGAGEEDDKKRRERREYQLYFTRMTALSGLNGFTYQDFDYQPDLQRKQFVEPAVPNYGYLLIEAEKKAKEGYFARIGMVSALVVGGIFFDALLMGAYAGILSVMFILGATAAIFQQVGERRRAVDRAVESAKVTGARMMAEFLLKVENDRLNFEVEEEDRIDNVKRILAGVSLSVLEVCRTSAALVKIPFKLSGGLELVGKEIVINFELPDREFVPPVEWLEEKNGNFSVTDRSVMNINRLYNNAIIAAMLHTALRILERAPSLETVCMNGYFQEEGRAACLASMRMTREDIDLVTQSDNALSILEKLGNVRLQTNSSLAKVEPVSPEWIERVSKQEILTSKIYCQSVGCHHGDEFGV